MKYFTIKEMCRSDKATALGIENKPTAEQIANMQALIDNVLDVARERLGSPIKVSSGFRCEKLNKAVKGAANSQHKKGQAADLVSLAGDNAKLFSIIREMGNFDQLIWEYGTDKQPDWVHVSYKQGANRHEVRRKYKGDPIYYILK